MFDFGLAKRITNADAAEDDLYNLTGNTGSLRYMAPEVVSRCVILLPVKLLHAIATKFLTAFSPALFSLG